MPSSRPSFRVVATSLLSADVSEADRIVDALRQEGWPNASRSLVIREALGLLTDDLRGKTSEEIFQYFIERRGRRISRPKADHAAGGRTDKTE